MTTANNLFVQHLEMLSKVAEEQGLLLVDVLPHFIGDPPAQKQFGNFGILDPRIRDNDKRLRQIKNEQLKLLIERYRPVFYEQELDRRLREPCINLYTLPKEILAKWNNAIRVAKKHIREQTEKARKSRSIKNENDELLDEVVSHLGKNNPDEKPGELWPHLKTAIEEWSDGNCTETKTSIRDSWRYQFKIGEKEDSITFGVFRKKLRK